MNDPLYQTILKKSEVILSNPEGLSDHHPQSKADQIPIKQNNTIILLLLEINKKLEVLIKEKSPDTGIEELVTQLKRIELTPQKERPVKQKRSWKFFQVEEETAAKEIAIPLPKTI